MPDIYDPERGLKISLTDDDYEDYQNGNLTDDFYARRTDGSIANRVNISPLDDENEGDEDEDLTKEIDPESFAKGVAIVLLFGGIGYGIKKLWDRHKAKKAEAQAEDSVQTASKTVDTLPSTETLNYDQELKLLTQEEAIQELMNIIVGMAEIADGKKKVSESVENLSNAGVVDKATLLEKLADPEVLENFNAYLEQNPQIVMQNQTIFSGIFGRDLTADGQYVPLSILDIKRRLRTESIKED